MARSPNYLFPPLAGNQGCNTPCIDAPDSRIAATPIYSNGLVSFAFETGINNGNTGLRSPTNRRWGDYETASIDGAGALWVSSQFSGTSGDWATEIGATTSEGHPPVTEKVKAPSCDEAFISSDSLRYEN